MGDKRRGSVSGRSQHLAGCGREVFSGLEELPISEVSVPFVTSKRANFPRFVFTGMLCAGLKRRKNITNKQLPVNKRDLFVIKRAKVNFT